MTKAKNVDVLDGDIDSTFRKLAAPLALGFVLNIVNGWVDKIYVSHLGEIEIASIGVSEQISLLLFALGMGFAIGTGVVVARRIGEGKQDEANNIATQALTIMFVYAIVVTLICYLSLSPLLSALGYSGEINFYAIEYMHALLLGAPFNFLIFQSNAIVRSSGNTLFPMYMIGLTIIINAILAPLLIFDFILPSGLGIFGAGLATAIAQFIGFGIALFFLIKGYTPVKLKLKEFKPDIGIIKVIVKRGIPSTLQYLALSFNRMGMFALANTYGVKVVAAYTLGLSFDLFSLMPIFGAAAAVEIISGINRGAGKIHRIFDYFYSAIKQITFLVIPLMALAFFGGEKFASMFSDDPEIIKETGKFLSITSLSYMFFAIGVICTRVVSGAGDTKRSFFIYSGVLFVVQLPLAWILAKFFNMQQSGLYYGIFSSYLFFMFLGLYHVYRMKWLRVKF